MGFFVTFLLYAAMAVLSDLLLPKPEFENAKPAGVGDFRFPTATEGRVVPLLWGTVRIEGPNVVWYGDLRQDAIVERVATGIFSREDVVRGYEYRVGFQQALCRGPLDGPLDGLLGVWNADDKVFEGTVTDGGTFTINEPELYGGSELGNGGLVTTQKFFAGSASQAASTYLSSFQSEGGDTPGYNGTCYVAPDAAPSYIGNSTQVKPWKFEVRRIPNGLGLITAEAALNSGNDCNPMNVIYEIMTNIEWGLGIDPADIDTTDFSTAAATLATEGNGFSFLLDREERAEDMIGRVEEQIDGITFFNQIAGKWQMNLARDDYDVMTIPLLDDTNVLEIKSFTKQTWEGTVNQFSADFNQRDDNYKDTSGFAQDMANVSIQGGINVSSSASFPGVKDKTLANAIAWRQLRTLSFPVVQAQLVVTREFYDVQPSSVYAFTNADAGFVRLPMRVRDADLGEIADGKITLDLVQDIFFSAAGTFADPPGSGWTNPQDDLAAFPTGEQEVIEAPRALTARDPGSGSPDVDKLMAWARRQGVAVTYKILERNHPSTPAGSFSEAGEVFGFAHLGMLSGTLSRGSAFPLTSLLVTADPDTQADMLDELPSAALDLVGLGTNLTTLIAIGNEFMLCTHAETSGGDVQLNNVYRGVLDTVMEDHAANADVWLVFVGMNLSNESIPAGNAVDVKLLPRSATDLVSEGDAVTISFSLDDRVRKPYPPSELSIDNVRFGTTGSLEFTGTGETDGIDLDFLRRDFRTAEGGDEIGALGVDAPSIFTDFPTANTTTHEVEVIDDPAGSPTTLFTHSIGSGNSATITRLDILENNDGVVPSTLQFRLRSTHLFQSTSYDSLFDLTWDFSVTSALSSLFNFGARLASADSLDFVVASDTVDHVFNLSSSFTVGDVEYRINGGSWTTLISAGGTGPGTIANALLTNGDTIEIQHLSTDTDAQKLITMTVSATPTAYGVLYT